LAHDLLLNLRLVGLREHRRQGGSQPFDALIPLG
jgi:hypothetical protein